MVAARRAVERRAGGSMGRLRYLTAGESHGPALVGILEGLPAGLELSAEDIDLDLARRQRGHGRGGRQRIERDAARILAGVRHGRTLGSPLAIVVENRDFRSWSEEMAVEPGRSRAPVSVPRPGHADLAGALKYGWREDLRNVFERASARETAMRVALGAASRRLLSECGVEVASFVSAIGDARAPVLEPPREAAALAELRARADASPVRCPDEAATAAMVEAIDRAKADRDSLGGVVEVVACGVPVGLGSHVHWDRKLDARLLAALASVQAVKGVEVGAGFAAAGLRGSEVHDPIERDLGRASNHAGGIEGGMSNGEPIRLRVAKKPISTLMRPLRSVDLASGAPADAHVERADTCAVPALGVICEAVTCLTLADALLETFGGDTVYELRERVERRRLASR
jgi:chorismate synthase